MTAVNHALTGTAIGLLVGQPLLAIPAAVASHFVCDALPHFASSLPDPVLMKSARFRDYLIAEAGLCFAIVLGLTVLRPEHWLLAAICAFAAAAPDLLSVNKYLAMRRGKQWKPGRYIKFANGIQWFARPIGAVVEVAWFIGVLIVIIPFLR